MPWRSPKWTASSVASERKRGRHGVAVSIAYGNYPARALLPVSGASVLRPPAFDGTESFHFSLFYPKIHQKFEQNLNKIRTKIHKNLSENFPKIKNNFKIIQCKFTIFYANFPGLTNWDILDKWIKFNCFNPKIPPKLKKIPQNSKIILCKLTKFYANFYDYFFKIHSS